VDKEISARRCIDLRTGMVIEISPRDSSSRYITLGVKSDQVTATMSGRLLTHHTMPIGFDLVITANYPNLMAEFRLLDTHGSLLAYRQTEFRTIAASRVQGLFDLRNYLRLYVEEGKEAAAVAEIGVCIAEEVLGKDIFERLWKSKSQRTLRIQLLGAAEEENHLTAALARVPWEIARPSAEEPTLGERSLLVRIVHDMKGPALEPLKLNGDEPLRLLFVFAEARGSKLLQLRQERRELLRLFEEEIYPRRRVVAHFLAHGVTRERLEAQIKENGGYHLVHWSGHGKLNQLELARPGGARNRISGPRLLEILTQSGRYLPRLVFLSACHSGDILDIRIWDDFFATALRKEPRAKAAEIKPLDFAKLRGFIGTAYALLQGAVPSVVAMRYAVGDDYARELAVEFYRELFAQNQTMNAAAALNLARQSLLEGMKHNRSRFVVCDHATPVLYGAEQPGLTLAKGRSPGLNPSNPRLHQIAELTTAGHEHFVGRTWELAGLGANFIGSKAWAEVKPVAVITGLGGMGKTALVAEALALWETRFEFVLLYQAKPNPLGFEAMLRDIHLNLMGEVHRYHTHVKERPADAIYREGTAEFTGRKRLDRLTQNLLRAFKDEAILLVLDNFETNLKSHAEPRSDELPAADQTTPLAFCQDPAWDHCLTSLARELASSPSRVLITCRRQLAALAEQPCHPVPLGPLPKEEAALYLGQHPDLSRMVFGSDAGEKVLAMRLLNASRFHPLLMDRLARLASDAKLRPQLLQALDTLEKTKEFGELPALFATRAGDAKELAYLNDALATSLDQLVRGASLDARLLLWTIAVANEPVTLGLLKSVWSGEDGPEQAEFRQIKQMLDRMPLLPAELQEKLQTMSPKFRAILDALPPEPPAPPEITPLLRHLVSVGLATEERTGPDDDNPELTCHELVRERIRAWMEQQSQDRGEWSENAIRLAYSEWLEAIFKTLQHRDMTAALLAGSRALVYCVQAGAWDRLSGFASGLVTSTSEPRLLEDLIPHLRTAAESAPEGKSRWRCLGSLAAALRLGGRPDASLPFFERSVAQARATAEAESEDSQEAWGNLAAIISDWAKAFVDIGNLHVARQRLLEAAEAEKKAGGPVIHVIGIELEALRIEIMQGQMTAALPQAEALLAQVQAWWQRHRSGQPVPEAPDAEFLARALIGALDIAKQADIAREDWKSAVRRIDDILEVERAVERPAEEIAVARMNRAIALLEVPGRSGEARAELEACLPLFLGNPAAGAKVLTSLAYLFDEQGDVAQAIIQERRALARYEQLPDPADRAVSHNNLAAYLERSGTPSAIAEAPRHQLAALLYCLVAGLGQSLQTYLRNYAIDFRNARAAGTELAVPRVTQLLADPAFHPLEQWLPEHLQHEVDVIQGLVDQFLAEARTEQASPNP
jgi:tetratricopeptide (TPR) repeat protein